MLKRSILVSGLRLLDLSVCAFINMYSPGKLPVCVCMCLSDERGFWAVCTYCHFFPMSCLFKDIAADFESQSNKLAQKNPAVLLSVFSFNFVCISTLISSASLSLLLFLHLFLFLQWCQCLIKQARSFSTLWLYGYGPHSIPQAWLEH